MSCVYDAGYIKAKSRENISTSAQDGLLRSGTTKRYFKCSGSKHRRPRQRRYEFIAELLHLACCVTVPVPCLESAAPVSNAELTVSRDTFGTIATYVCPPGWYFADGGTRRTLVCTDGTWPHNVPVCTGI